MPSDLQKPNRRNASTAGVKPPDKLPPAAPDIEAALLGCCVLSPDCVDEIQAAIKGNADIFYDLRYKNLWQAIVEVHQETGGKFDQLLLVQHLRDFGMLDDVGGMSVIAKLGNDSMPGLLPTYLQTLTEKYALRQAIRIHTEAVGKIYEREGDGLAVLDETEAEFLKQQSDRQAPLEHTMKSLVQGFITEAEYNVEHQGVMRGLSTGLIDLDKLTGGLRNKDMIVIGGRPSSGKTACGMQIAEHVAVNLHAPVGIFSLEMSAEALVARMMASRSRVNLRHVRDGYLSERDFPALTGAAGKLSSAPIYIDDTSAISIITLRAKARRMWQQYGIKLLVVDYFQLLNVAKRSNNKSADLMEVSAGLKALAKELNIPIIVLSQLGRDTEKRKGKDARPRMSDLSWSGALECDADVLMMLSKEKGEEGDELEVEEDCAVVNLDLIKQRSGPTGHLKLTFIRSITRFESVCKVSDEDVP